MSKTKPQIIQELKAKNIPFNPDAKVKDLQALLPKEGVPKPTDLAAAAAQNTPVGGVVVNPANLPPQMPVAPTPSEEDLADIEVGDPQVLRPVELPLVIKPKDGGDWKNEAQAYYARVLNGYAYKNPKKWAKKKSVLLARLVEIGNDETAIAKYRADEGGEDQPKIEYKDKRFTK